MGMRKIAVMVLSLAAFGLLAAPTDTYTEDKGARVDRLL